MIAGLRAVRPEPAHRRRPPRHRAPLLWGRAEGVRTLLRTGAQALAPLLFGAVSEYVFGGGRSGLQWTFVVMLVPLAANAVILFRAMRTYPRDVATAAAATPPSDVTIRGTHPRRTGARAVDVCGRSDGYLDVTTPTTGRPRWRVASAPRTTRTRRRRRARTDRCRRRSGRRGKARAAWARRRG